MIELGTPEVVFEEDFRGGPGTSRYYEVGADGRLLMQWTGDEIDDETLTQVVLVENWFDELQRLVPTQ